VARGEGGCIGHARSFSSLVVTAREDLAFASASCVNWGTSVFDLSHRICGAVFDGDEKDGGPQL
jgi:hypothetical protein